MLIIILTLALALRRLGAGFVVVWRDLDCNATDPDGPSESWVDSSGIDATVDCRWTKAGSYC